MRPVRVAAPPDTAGRAGKEKGSVVCERRPKAGAAGLFSADVQDDLRHRAPGPAKLHNIRINGCNTVMAAHAPPDYTRPWQYLNFLPEPQGQGALRGILPQS